MIPMSTNDVAPGSRARNRVSRPMLRTLTTGQKSSSKTRKTLREAINKFRRANAHTAISSACQLNEDLLEVGLPDLDVTHDHALLVQGPQQLGQPLVGLIDRAGQAPLALAAAEHARELGEPGEPRRIEPQGDHV